jgi:hypothetical protein
MAKSLGGCETAETISLRETSPRKEVLGLLLEAGAVLTVVE